MPVISTVIGALGVGISAVGAIKGYQAGREQAKAQKNQIALQQRQADLEASRTKRQTYRDMLKAQALTEVAAASSGATGSSSEEGGLAQAANSSGQSSRDVNQNQEIGVLGAANSARVAGNGNSASAISAIGSGLTSLSGTGLVRSLGSFTSLGQSR